MTARKKPDGAPPADHDDAVTPAAPPARMSPARSGKGQTAATNAETGPQAETSGDAIPAPADRTPARSPDAERKVRAPRAVSPATQQPPAEALTETQTPPAGPSDRRRFGFTGASFALSIVAVLISLPAAGLAIVQWNSQVKEEEAREAIRVEQVAARAAASSEVADALRGMSFRELTTASVSAQPESPAAKFLAAVADYRAAGEAMGSYPITPISETPHSENQWCYADACHEIAGFEFDAASGKVTNFTIDGLGVEALTLRGGSDNTDGGLASGIVSGFQTTLGGQATLTVRVNNASAVDQSLRRTWFMNGPAVFDPAVTDGVSCDGPENISSGVFTDVICLVADESGWLVMNYGPLDGREPGEYLWMDLGW